MTSSNLHADAPVFVPSKSNSPNNSENPGRMSPKSSLRADSPVFFPSNPVLVNNSNIAPVSSSSFQATPLDFIPGANALAYEFQEMRLVDPAPIAVSAHDIDVRAFPQPDRSGFAQGPLIQIFAGEVFAGELPYHLFLATSTKPELLINGVTVQVPAHIDHFALQELIGYLNHMVFSRKDFPRMLTHHNDVSEMLSITEAALALGMKKYTDHIYRKCEAYLRRELPTYEDLNACVYFAQVHPRLLRIVAENMAIRVWEDDVPDREDFDYYLTQNKALDQEIKTAIGKREAYFRHLEELKQERMARFQRGDGARVGRERGVQRAKVIDEHTKEQEQWKKEKAEKAAKDKAFWDKKKAEDAEDAKSIEKKLLLPADKRKFTLREKAYWRTHRGTNKLPKGA